MKVELWQIGKTNFPGLSQGIEQYQKRIRRYIPFDILTLPDVKNARNMPPEKLKEKEAGVVLARLKKDDLLILLDENGKSTDSVAFAGQLEKLLHQPKKRLLFLVGGAYGFAAELRQIADSRLSLSPMTFSHQLVRLIFAEQLYRALTIIRNDPYHNE